MWLVCSDRWTKGGNSEGMAVMEFNQLSGFQAVDTTEIVNQLKGIKRVETKEQKVVVYLDEVRTSYCSRPFHAVSHSVIFVFLQCYI